MQPRKAGCFHSLVFIGHDSRAIGFWLTIGSPEVSRWEVDQYLAPLPCCPLYEERHSQLNQQQNVEFKHVV